MYINQTHPTQHTQSPMTTFPPSPIDLGKSTREIAKELNKKLISDWDREASDVICEVYTDGYIQVNFNRKTFRAARKLYIYIRVKAAVTFTATHYLTLRVCEASRLMAMEQGNIDDVPDVDPIEKQLRNCSNADRVLEMLFRKLVPV
jgi:hypothetical protein